MTCPCRPICFSPRIDCNPDVSARGQVIAAAVLSMPLFSGIDSTIMQRLMADSQPIDVHRGALLFTTGTEADCFYVVLSGQVKLFSLLPDGRESVIEVIHPIASFGEAAMLSGSNFPVNAEILKDGTLVRVGRAGFVSALNSDHSVAYRILSALCAWNLRLTSENELLRGQQAWRRVAEYLLTLVPTGADNVSFRLPFSKEVLASRLGIRRESLSRVFGKLRMLGITTSGSAVSIGNVEGLRLACENNTLPATD